MVGCFLIPIAHFVLAPAGPFIAGYWGIQYAPNPGRHYAIHGLMFGSLLALFMGFILAGVAALLTGMFDDPRVATLAWLGAGVFTLYTGSMGTMGAMFCSLKEQQRAKRESGQQEGGKEDDA
jgi:hypothetical protein